jgi:hypothetical protein
MHSTTPARAILVALLVAGLMNMPALAATAKPLGVVLTCDHAYLDHANAAAGASVYSADSLVTDQGGSLHLRAGASQIYLLSLTSASLEPRADKVQARVDRGTLGFSTSLPAQLEVQTPLGLVHGADANPIFGQVSILNPSKLRISSYKGTLIVDGTDGQQKTITEGETYEATLVAEASGGDDNPPKKAVTGAGINWAHVAEVAIPLAVAGFVACWLYPESPSGMGCWN